MGTEISAVSYLQNILSRSEYFEPHFSECDKGISWDGKIEVYNKAGDNHPKSDYYTSIPVQIKGHKTTDLSKKNITFSADIADIKNYFKGGGVLYFVVYINKTTFEQKIYYAKLLPYDLRKIILKHGKQKNHRIRLSEFPTDVRSMNDSLLLFASDMEKQKSSIHMEDVSITELAKNNRLDAISFSELPFPYEGSDLSYYFNNDFFIYADIGYGALLPVEKISDLTEIGNTFPSAIVIGDNTYYTEVKVIHHKDKREITIAKNINLFHVYDDYLKLTIKICGTLSERILLLKIFLDILKQKSFTVSNLHECFFIHDNDETATIDTPKLYKMLDELCMIEKAMRLLCVNVDIDINALDEPQIKTLCAVSHSIVNDAYILLPGADPNYSSNGAYVYEFDKAKIVLYYELNSGKIKFYDLFSVKYYAPYKDHPEDESHCPYYYTLLQEDLATISNINTDKILSNLQEDPYILEHILQISNFIQCLIMAFDTNPARNIFLLDLAYKMFSVLRTKDISFSECDFRINELQITKRKRELTASEKNELMDIICDYPDNLELKLDALILLDNQAKATKIFSVLPINSQNALRKSPIFKFFIESEDSTHGQTTNGNP